MAAKLAQLLQTSTFHALLWLCSLLDSGSECSWEMVFSVRSVSQTITGFHQPAPMCCMFTSGGSFFCLPPCKHYSLLQRQTIITPLPLRGLWLTQGRCCQLADTDWKIGFCPALGPLGTMVWSSEHQGRCKTALQASAHEHLGSLGTSVHVEIGDTL